ncbi:MAG: hypothetical protein GYA24_23855 [Candidatus Lokiarchaeota archaeon]|nr:hypothetical protein [Candidatus Lokiarchaeota archaeon]
MTSPCASGKLTFWKIGRWFTTCPIMKIWAIKKSTPRNKYADCWMMKRKSGRGLVTPADRIATPAELMDHMRVTGWTGAMETKRV